MLGFSITDPSNSLEWMIFLAKKYSGMFLEGTWLTLYIAVAGTILGFLLQLYHRYHPGYPYQ